MKRNKVLLGLFVGIMTIASGTVSGQEMANYRSGLAEVGPVNIGARVRTVLVDQADTTHRTVFAGAAPGGLYMRSADMNRIAQLYTALGVVDVPADTNIWHFIPMYESDGTQLTLPISSMVQISDSVIVIATGESYYPMGTRHTAFTSKGRGMYRFNTHTLKFTPIANTAPTSLTHNFASVNNIDFMYRGNTLYLFAATPKGLFKWKINSEADWSNYSTISTASVDQIMIIRSRNIAFFTSGSTLYKIGNVESAVGVEAVQDISSTNTAFGGTNSRIILAYAPSDNNYIYAMVLNASGYFENIYLTTNQQDWSPLATSSTTPFSFTTGATCGAICVDPSNPKKIYVGGTSMWVGERYTDEGYYTWSRTSYSEYELNSGSFMGTVFGASYYVHSGINQIVWGYERNPRNGNARTVYYVATDGGMFYSNVNCRSFSNVSRGMNGVRVNGLAVSPDGSLTIGASQYAVPFIESRMGHDGGDTIVTWYDNGDLGNMNHIAKVIWNGNGGQVAASMFQQIKPIARRTIFVSSDNGQYARAYDDYDDYNNTQTWSVGTAFMTADFRGGSELGVMALWETLNDTSFNDSIVVVFDTMGIIYRGDSVFDLSKNNGNDYLMSEFLIKAGDRMRFTSPGHADYPFWYTFPDSISTSRLLADSVSHLDLKYRGAVKAKNPIQSRLFAVGSSSNGTGSKENTNTSILMTWMPSDFRKVWSEGETSEDRMIWATLYTVQNRTNQYVRALAVSNDGKDLYAAVNNDMNGTSYIIHVANLDSVNYTQPINSIQPELENPRVGRMSVLEIDTLVADPITGSKTFSRPVSSLSVNPNDGTDELLITFEHFNDSYANIAYVANASDSATRTIATKPLANAGLPVYSAMIECTTGDVYVGTEDGVFKASSASFRSATPTWNTYGQFKGVPVTAIVQQTRDLPVIHHVGHTGVNADSMLFAKTKWPYAIYFGTYGRGVFLDMSMVTDTTNEISDPEDYRDSTNAIPCVNNIGNNRISIFPNPAVDNATVEIDLSAAGTAAIAVYDLAGRRVLADNLGRMGEGLHTYRLDCSKLAPGMYLVNLKVGNNTSAAKMVVK
ncbi:MAG: T9SS type A sorting domain-containing protein [Bacteroidales bacterium]|nr:T9SS type A sorting domain-containing protein [Bacteroidales bacterium]